jgi:hypothetical protein
LTVDQLPERVEEGPVVIREQDADSLTLCHLHHARVVSEA